MDTAISAERERFETLNQRHEAYSREHMKKFKREAEHVTRCKHWKMNMSIN